MRLAVVVDTFPRWSERFIARELAELARRGVDFSIFCLKAGTLPDAQDADFAGLDARRVVLPSCFMPKALAFKGDDALERRRRLARKELGLRGYAKIQCAAALATLLREGQFTQVYAHFASLPSTVAWLAATDAGLPFALSVHARDVFVEPQLLREKLQDCARLFTCHARAYEHLRAEATPGQREKITLMRHGLPLAQFPFRERAAEHQRPVPVILAAGRFVPKKGFATLLDAAADARLAAHDFRLVLLGEGPLEKKLRAQIQKRKLASKVEIHPPVAGAALRELYAQADLFVAPFETGNDGDSDGVPNTILEAFALVLPVLGTDAGGLGEILDARTGTVVAQKNPAALADALLAFLEDPRPFYARTRAARARIERDYDIRRNIEPLLSLAVERPRP